MEPTLHTVAAIAPAAPPPTPTSLALELRAVHRHFGKTPIIQGVDLAVVAGQRVAIIGPNGAGKSTLFNLISGRHAPSSGQIYLQGQRIDGQAPHLIYRLGLSRSFQISSLFTRLSVFENLRCSVLWSLGYGYSFWRHLSGLHDANARTQQLLELLQLTPRQDTLAMHLSYAEQRTLELGMTLASGAQVILLDEPTAGMSRSETTHFIALIRQATQGRTLLTVEHDMEVVFGLADKIAVLVQGQIIAYDTPEQVRANPAVQAAYLGSAWADVQEG